MLSMSESLTRDNAEGGGPAKFNFRGRNHHKALALRSQNVMELDFPETSAKSG